MRSKLAVLGVVALVAAALVYWFGFRHPAKASAKAPAVAADDPWAKPRATKPADAPDQPARSNRIPTLAHETDPDGPLLLEGQVLDEDEKPVKGAVVRISTSPPRTVETEDDGSFSFDKLLGRSYELIAHDGDKIGGPVTTKVVARAEPVVIRLRLGARLTVNVTDATTKKPIAGATVAILDGFDFGPRKGKHDGAETTNPEGKAVFRGLDDGWTNVVASAPGYGPTTGNKVIGKGQPTVTIELALRKGAALSGQVIDEQHQGLAGVRVWATDVSNAWEQNGMEQTAVTSGADGRFTIPALSAGSYFLHATDDGHAPVSTAPVTVTESPTTGVEIVMKEAASIAGVVVTPEGRPVPYATVSLSSSELSADMVRRQAAADADGKFVLKSLPRSPVKLRAESEDAASKVVEVDLAKVAQKNDVKLVVDQTATIAGIVVDDTGEAIAEAEVTAYPDFLAGQGVDSFVLAQGASASTDGDGKFTVKGLEAGKYRVLASRSMGGQTSRGKQAGVPAETGAKDVRIVLPAPGGVKGKVELDTGGAPELAIVSSGWEHRVTIRDGAFELSELVPGKYDLRVTGADFADKFVRDIEIKPGKVTDAGTITVRPGRKITGRIVDGKGAPVEGARVLFGKMLMGDGKSTGGSDDDQAGQLGLRSATTDNAGRFVIAGAPRSGGSLGAEHPERGRAIAQKIPAGKDDVREVVLTLKGYGSIAGKVTRKGEPVPGAMISAAPIGSSGQALFITAGADGSFVIDKVPEGPNGLSAMKTGMMSMDGSSRTVTVVAGQRVDGSVDIPAGALSLTVKVEAKPGNTVNAAQIFLFRGRVNVTMGDEILGAFFANQGVKGHEEDTELTMSGAAGMLFWFGNVEAFPTFKELIAGHYSVCTIPITGDVSNEQEMGRIQRNIEQLAVVCQPVTVEATPPVQTVTSVVPTMKPLTDEQE